MTTKISQERGLPAHEYCARLERAPVPRTPRLYYLALIPVAFSLWLWPGMTLAAVCIGGPVILLAWFWWSCHEESKNYNDDHDLP